MKHHAIILAAGKGSRLAGKLPPYYKPMMTINGESLIVRTARMIHEVTPGSKLTVVAAPENALPLTQLLNDAQVEARIVIQRRPEGPATAVLEALTADESTRALVIMGDNVMEPDALQAIVEAGPLAVGGFVNDGSNISTFTRFRHGSKTWVEKVEMTPEDDKAFVWVGPLSAPSVWLWEALSIQEKVNGEYPIGPAFNRLPTLNRVEIKCEDIGV